MPLTAQSDLFSAGVLLWEMLTGESLFARETAEETLAAVTDGPVDPPSSRRPELPALVDTICARALARDLSDRYLAAADFLAALNRYSYSVADPLTALDLSRLVARYCPPIVRARAADEPEPIWPGDDPETDGADRPRRMETTPLPGRLGTVPAPRRMETTPLPGRLGTVRLPRDRGDDTQPVVGDPGATARPKGKRRATTVRTFATHAALEKVLGKATPLHPIPAITGDDGDDGDDSDDGDAAAAAQTMTPAPAAVVAADTASVVSDARTQNPPAEPTPGRRRVIAVAAIGAAVVAVGIALAGIAVTGDDRAEVAIDAALDGAAVAPDAAADRVVRLPDTEAPAVDAGADAATPDGPASARVTPRRVRDAATPADTAPGSLRVGANPWGEVYVDGRRLGRAPNEWPVPAGAHRVEVRFPVPGREQSRWFDVTIEPGEVTNLGVVDFTGS